MDTDFFTIIIRSNSKTNTTDNTNNCTIRMKCPSHYKFIQVSGVSFYADFPTTITFNGLFAELRSNNIDIYDSFDTSLGTLQTFAFENTTRLTIDRANMNFKLGNFNNKTINFQLLNETGVTLKEIGTLSTTEYNRPWVLVLKCKGLME
jgi:hypothetical protein